MPLIYDNITKKYQEVEFCSLAKYIEEYGPFTDEFVEDATKLCKEGVFSIIKDNYMGDGVTPHLRIFDLSLFNVRYFCIPVKVFGEDI